MSVTCLFRSTLTLTEVLPVNTGSATAAKRTVTHENYNISKDLNSGTTPPVTLQASFLLTLTEGAAEIDLRTLVGTNGAVVDGNGLKVQLVRIKNLGANLMTFYEGATNGHNAFSVDSGEGVGGQAVQPGGSITIESNDNGDDISDTTKTWDVLGTSAQTAEITIVMG